MTEQVAPKPSIVVGFRRIVVWVAAELRWIGRVLLSSSDRFYWDNGFSKAASLAYTSLLSLVPVTALCFGIVAHFIQSHTAVQEFVLGQFLPGGNATVPNLVKYLEEFNQNIRALNVAVIATLVFTAVLLLNSIEFALNEVWQVFEARSITDRIIIFCAIIVIFPALAVSGYYTSSKVEPMVAGIDILNSVYHDALPFLIDFLAFVGLYLIPKAPVRVSSAVFGALVSSVLFGWAKNSFAWYINYFTSYSSMYGTIASAVPIFLFWLYISWTIVLFGAEVSYQAQYLPRVGKLWKRSIMTVGDAAMLLSMQALVMVVRAFQNGRKIPSELDIAEALGCSSVVLKPSLDALVQAGVIRRGDGKDMPLLLMRTPEKITMSEVREALFKARSCMFFGEEMTRVFQTFQRGQDAAKVTLADIAKE